MINKAILHGADAEPATPNHNEELVSTISALAGYSSIDMSVQEIDEAVTFEGESKTYIDGVVSSLPHTRLVYNVKLFPMTYNSASHITFWDASNERTLRAILAKQYKWLELTTYASDVSSSITYHASGKAIPVALKTYTHTSGEGLKRISFQLMKVWRES